MRINKTIGVLLALGVAVALAAYFMWGGQPPNASASTDSKTREDSVNKVDEKRGEGSVQPGQRRALQLTERAVRFRSEASDAVQGVRVRASGKEFVSGADGVAILPRDAARLCATHPDYKPLVAVLSEASTGVTELTLVRGSEVLGVVIDESGSPVAGAEVELRLGAVSALSQVESDYVVREVPGGNAGVAYRRTIRTDREGKFAFRGVCSGLHVATASKDGYIGAVLSDDRRYRALHKHITVDAGRNETIELELRKLYGAVVRVVPNPELPLEIWRSCVGIEYSEPRAMAMLSYAHAMIGRKLEKQLRSKFQDDKGSLVSAHVVLARTGMEIGEGNDRSPLAVDYFGDIRFRKSLRFVPLAKLTEADVCKVSLRHGIDEVVDLKVVSAFPVQAHRIVKGNVTGYVFLAKANQKGEYQFRLPKGEYELRAPQYTFLDEEKYQHRVNVDGAKNRVVDIRDENDEIYTWRVAVKTEGGEPASDFLLSVTSIRETGDRQFTRRAAGKLSEFSFIAPRGSYRVALRRLNGQLVEKLTVELVRDTKTTLHFPK